MSAPEGIVQAQTEALLRRVAREQEMLSRRARDTAVEQARSIVERARDEARARLRQAATDAHQSLERALADRRAALDTSARQREQALLSELMDRAWRVLPGELAAVWTEDTARRRWCAAACAIARRIVLGEGRYTLEVDPALPEAEARGLAHQLASDDGLDAELRSVAGLGPGLRIRRGLACVDATIPGLLGSRQRVEAELLAELDALLAEQGGTAP